MEVCVIEAYKFDDSFWFIRPCINAVNRFQLKGWLCNQGGEGPTPCRRYSVIFHGEGFPNLYY